MPKSSSFAVLCLSIALFVLSSSAQIPITNFDPITENFDSMSSGASLPPNWLVSAPATIANWNTSTNTGTMSYIRVLSETIPVANGSVNWTCPNCVGDRTPGFLPTSSYGSPNTLIAHYRNDTGYLLNFVRLTFNMKQFRISNSNLTITPEWSRDGITWIMPRLALMSNTPSGGIPTDPTPSYLDSSNTVAWPRDLPWLDLVTNDIPNGGDLYIRWVFDGELTAAHGIGIDDVTIEAYRSDPTCRPINVAATPIAENFDSLDTSAFGDTLPNGFGYFGQGSLTTSYYQPNSGSVGTGGLYNFGSNGASDRALGSIYSSNFQGRIGACFVNNTGRPITSLNIKYDGEMWRTGSSNRADRLIFGYSSDAENLTSGTWIPVSSLDFNAPQLSSGTKNGNSPANRVAGITDTIEGLNIPNGSNFYLRWIDFDASSSDDALGIDNFEITAFVPTAAGVSVAGRIAEANGTPIRGAVVTISGGNLLVPQTRRTGTFGRYSFESLSAGETYFVSVRAARHSFAEPSRIVHPDDSVVGVDFIAISNAAKARR